MTEFREFMLDWLERQGWSKNRLAEATGTSQPLWSRYLHEDPGKRIRPNDRTLRKLAPVVGRSHDELMRMAGRLDAQPTDHEPHRPRRRDYAAELADVGRALLAIAEQMRRDSVLVPDRNPISEHDGSGDYVGQDRLIPITRIRATKTFLNQPVTQLYGRAA